MDHPSAPTGQAGGTAAQAAAGPAAPLAAATPPTAGNAGSAAAAGAPAAESVAHRLRTRFASRRILIAEDDPVNRVVIAEMLLELAGLDADLAANGALAVEKARTARYALILMDLQMPVMDGIRATQEIRRLPGYGETPVLALTASALGDYRPVCLAAGMDDVVAKPVDSDLLLAKVLYWLEWRQSSDPTAE